LSISRKISEDDCKKLAQKIRDDFYRPINTFKTTMFLCGADISLKDKLRYRIAEEFKNFRGFYSYEIIYPEDIFDELLYSSKSKDLLSLENLLADSVDIILMIPESPGSFAELGAFANNNKLRKKIVCVIDVKYKKDKSFINQGPIKLIKKANKEGVLFLDVNNISDEMDKIKFAINKTKKKNKTTSKSVNLLQLDSFLLPTIYLLEPINDITLSNIVGEAINDASNSYEATRTALSILTKKKEVESTIEGYKLTELGLTQFESLRKISSRIKIQDKTVALDNLRLEILNFKLRNKKMKV
jgi:hypothetical protein